MPIIEGIKDFLIGLTVIVLGAILAVILILLWPFIAVVGWLAIMLLLVALAIIIGFGLIIIVGRLVRGSYRK